MEFWQTQESLRDEIRRLEEDVKAANKKTRDAESKYINLAATPPKVQVKTVSVVSENMRKRLDELIDKNRDLETLLKQTKVEHNSTVTLRCTQLTHLSFACLLYVT